MKKKKNHSRPMQYRVRYSINGSLTESTQYYNAFHSSQTLDFLSHTYRKGHIHGSVLRIRAVEEYNRFDDTWEDRTTKAVEHATAPEVSVEGEKVFLKRTEQELTPKPS